MYNQPRLTLDCSTTRRWVDQDHRLLDNCFAMLDILQLVHRFSIFKYNWATCQTMIAITFLTIFSTCSTHSIQPRVDSRRSKNISQNYYSMQNNFVSTQYNLPTSIFALSSTYVERGFLTPDPEASASFSDVPSSLLIVQPHVFV